MEKLFAVLLIVGVSSGAFGRTFRHKRQSNDNANDLEDRYGWDRPRQRPPWSNQNQNNFPWQNQNGQGQMPWNQNQNGGNGQFPWNQNQNGQGQMPWNQNQNGGNGQFPWNQNQNQEQRATTTPAPTVNGTTNTSTNAQTCMSRCPVTSEYNPVCGTDNVTYTNPGRLGCAQQCGVNVALMRASPCPTTTPAPAS